MTMKVIIRNTPPNFYWLAAKAAQEFVLQSENNRGVFEYKEGPTFWVSRSGAGNISVSGEKVKFRP
jgi:hypothetical protein